MIQALDRKSALQVGEAAYAGLRRSKRMVFWTTLLTLATALFVGIVIYLDYQRTIQSVTTRLTHVANQFNQTFRSSLDIAAFQLQDVIEELAEEGLGEVDNLQQRFRGRLFLISQESEQLGTILIADTSGVIRAGTIRSLLGIDISDRAYFKEALNAEIGDYVLGAPIVARNSGAKVTPIAWPIARIDTQVTGIIASSLDEAYFESLLTETRLEDNMIVEIVSKRGPIAFSSAPGGRDMTDPWIQSQVSIGASSLATRVMLPRSQALSAFWARSVSFALIAVSLYGCALFATIVANTRSALLAEALAMSELEAERAVQARSQFQAIFQNVEDGIVVFDEAGLVEDANMRARELLGVRDVPSAIAAIRAHRKETMGKEPGAAARDHETFRVGTMADGEIREIRCRVSEVTGVTGQAWYCVLSDISAEERLTNTRLQFVESINHELRTPLTSLRGSLNIFMARYDADLSESGRKLIQMAERNADRLLLLVNDVLTLHAVDNGGLSVAPERLSTDEIIAEAITSMRGYADGFGVVLRAAEPLVESVILADRNRMQQVMTNLISNAVKYSPRGEVVLVGNSLRDDGTVELWCRDKGPGIPAHARAGIFERFAKPAHETGQQATGTGLGLAITRELVKHQGGSLELRTVHRDDLEGGANHGSTFIVAMPSVSPEKRLERRAS